MVDLFSNFLLYKIFVDIIGLGTYTLYLRICFCTLTKFITLFYYYYCMRPNFVDVVNIYSYILPKSQIKVRIKLNRFELVHASIFIPSIFDINLQVILHTQKKNPVPNYMAANI